MTPVWRVSWVGARGVDRLATAPPGQRDTRGATQDPGQLEHLGFGPGILKGRIESRASIVPAKPGLELTTGGEVDNNVVLRGFDRTDAGEREASAVFRV